MHVIPASLQIPAFRRLLAASTLSVIGSLMTFVVLPVVAWQETGSSSTFAFVMAGGALGMLVAMPFGGVLADRFDRRRLMLAGDAAQVLVMSAMFLAVTTSAWWALPPIEFLATFVGSLFASAGPALRRDALTDDVRTQGSALFNAGMNGANLVGPLLGAAIYAFAGFGMVIAVDIVTFVLSFLLLLGLRMDTLPPGAGEDTDGVAALVRRTFADIASGLHVARVDPFLRRSLGAAMCGGLANGFLLVAVVPWLDRTLGLSTEWWGIAIATMGGAGLAGALFVARLGERVEPRRLIGIGAACFASGALLLLASPSTPRLMLAFVLIGFTNAALSVGTSTVTQRRVASSHQGRISSLFVCSHQLTQLVSTLVAGFSVDAMGPSAGMGVAVVMFVATAAMYWRSAGTADAPSTTFTEEQLALGA